MGARSMRDHVRPVDVDARDITVWFNPSCSKCRDARGLLEERDTPARLYQYLEERPSREQLEHVLRLLGTDEPRDMMRTGEALYVELGLADASRDELLDAMAAHPILIERPIVIRGGRAVVARPPERLLELLES